MMSDFEVIRSRQNPLCRTIRKLRSSRSFRYETGLFLADGVKLVEEALKWGHVEQLILSEECSLDFPAVKKTFVTAELMQYISAMDTPQGIMAICKMPQPAAPKLVPSSLVLDGIQDPGNLGTIIRTADALSVPLFLLQNCSDPYNEKTVRASMGAVFRSAPAVISDAQLFAQSEENSIPVAVTVLSSDSVDIRTTAAANYIWMIGNEGHGIRPELISRANLHVIIPMNPDCESMNAAIAATIIMWQLKQ